MTKIIIANWKMNPAKLDEAQDLFAAEVKSAGEYASITSVICPPVIFIEELSKIDREHLGAQDIFWEGSGPYTGEISPDMLKNFGVTHVLVGHSDRRYKIGETDEVINKKIKAALAAGITPVLLVGERNRGDDRKKILEDQITADLNGLNAGEVSKILITYEPVWAISTAPGAEPDTPENTLGAIKIIKDFLAISYKLSATGCLYGGSVNEKNVADFLKYPEISGAVIGGASLHKQEFAEISKIAATLG